AEERGTSLRKRRKVPEHVKRAADRAAARSAGEDPHEVEEAMPAAPLDPPVVAPKPPTVYPIVSPGRVPEYRAKFAEIAKAMCKRGATDAELAAEFGVTTWTIWHWQAKHPAFSKALKIGKSAYDDRVERSLAQRAIGYSFTAVKI